MSSKALRLQNEITSNFQIENKPLTATIWPRSREYRTASCETWNLVSKFNGSRNCCAVKLMSGNVHGRRTTFKTEAKKAADEPAGLNFKAVLLLSTLRHAVILPLPLHFMLHTWLAACSVTQIYKKTSSEKFYQMFFGTTKIKSKRTRYWTPCIEGFGTTTAECRHASRRTGSQPATEAAFTVSCSSIKLRFIYVPCIKRNRFKTWRLQGACPLPRSLEWQFWATGIYRTMLLITWLLLRLLNDTVSTEDTVQ